jgi:hypothetical protein
LAVQWTFTVFPRLEQVETGSEDDCVIYYLQFEFAERRRITGASGNVEKMLKPLKIRTFEVRSPDDVRRALAKILKEVAGYSKSIDTIYQN